MGRPIKKKFFGNLNLPKYGSVSQGSGVGGEGVSSITLPANKPAAAGAITVSFTAPQIAGGVTATGTPVKTGNTVTSVTIVTAGSGYTSAPTVTFTGTNVTYHTNGTAVLTTTRPDAITIVSYLTTGSSAVSGGDIIKQEASKRYLIQNSQGRGICRLATGVLAPGQMHIIAADGAGGTYYVTKLTAHKARLVNRTNTSTAIYTSGQVAPWNITVATGTYVTLNHTI